MWDRDFPAPPALLTVKHDGKEIPAVAQTTKEGYLYVFNRVNGKPLFPIVYRKYPPSTVPGEVAAKEQPTPLEPAPYARQRLTEDLLTNRTPAAHAWAVQRFRELRSEGQFVPFSVDKGTVVYPSFEGGGEWGGPAVDPETGVIYINSNNYASIGVIAKQAIGPGGRGVYLSQCSVCHGQNLAGSPPEFPSLINIGTRLSAQQIAARIHQGGGRMPAFPNIQGDELKALLAYLSQRAGKDFDSAGSASTAVTYNLTGYKRFQDQDGYPATAPPWGTLNAINLNTGEYVWKIPLGQYPASGGAGIAGHGNRKLWRTDRDRGRPAVYRRNELRQKIPRLRQGHRQAAVGDNAAFPWQCYSGDV